MNIAMVPSRHLAGIVNNISSLHREKIIFYSYAQLKTAKQKSNGFDNKSSAQHWLILHKTSIADDRSVTYYSSSSDGDSYLPNNDNVISVEDEVLELSLTSNKKIRNNGNNAIENKKPSLSTTSNIQSIPKTNKPTTSPTPSGGIICSVWSSRQRDNPTGYEEQKEQ
eukprot:CAMPEP_0183729630 /NCGR_PEP_ID=MMETSP0737-20130205/30787_1 /TAXON_ID=385413 /ORGANISM="Thalassiosira miniscula, Strain CCMP1093" /LENGTH=166 /DNA_ID=CAMNT_0025961867 /DNA_START=228 /DNA_END=729 /DNA_ORIENTATION=-